LNAISSVVYCLICMIKYFLVEVMSVLSWTIHLMIMKLFQNGG
jgi:hypothetical protein